MVVINKKTVPDKLIVPESVTNIFRIEDGIGAQCIGNMNDARFMVAKIRQTAAQFKFDNAYEIPVRVLAQRIGNEL